LFSDLFEGVQNPIPLLFGMGCHITCPGQFSPQRHGRADDGIDKDPFFEKELTHHDYPFSIDHPFSVLG